jgi:glutathione S-transferase
MRFVNLEEARAARGLRLVVTAGVPSPWSETAKGCFDAKGIDYLAVRLTPRDADTRAWTGRHNAPVAMYDDEPPRSGFAEIVALADRIGDKAPLVPASQADRIEMWGMVHEILGEGGLVWSLRLVAIHEGLASDGARGFPVRAARYLGARYGYEPARIAAARDRIQSVLPMLCARLEDGRRYFVGGALSALDISVAAALGVLVPLPEEQCPMSPDFRRTYQTWSSEIADAVSATLLAHRDFMYQRHLALPVAF